MEPPQRVFDFIFPIETIGQVILVTSLVALLVIMLMMVCATGGQKAMLELSDNQKKLLSDKSPKFEFLKDGNGFLFALSASLIFLRLISIFLFLFIWKSLIIISSFWVDYVLILSFLVILFWKIEIAAQIISKKWKAKLFVRGRLLFVFFYSFPAFAWVRKLLTARVDYIGQMSQKPSVKVASGELAKAIELTIEEELSTEEQKIFEGIVKFGNTEARQIMKSRIDMISINKSSSFDQVMELVREHGYSRVPVFENRQDNVVGVLNIKDLLPHLNENGNFVWQQLIREPYFIPETKKIDDLLKEFQHMKMHIAIVVDEYGGTSGIVTLEDVLEEILGDISDEFDDDEVIYSKIDDQTYVFEGRTKLNDFYKITKVSERDFEERKGDAETLGGFIVETSGRILKNNEHMSVGDVKLIVESSDKRRVKLIKVEIN